MDEMKMLEDLGQYFDHDPPVTLMRQRGRLVAGAGRRRDRMWTPRWRLPVAAGLAAGVALTVVLVTGIGAGHTNGPPKVRLDAATVVLNRAASVVESRAAISPGPHQWVYTKSVAFTRGEPKTTYEDWRRFDAKQEAYFQGGRLVVANKHGESGPDTPLGAYDTLGALPTDPKAALAVLNKEVGTQPYGGAGPGKAGLLFANIVQLLRNSPIGAPPRVQATLYRVIAMIPGVRVVPNVTDILGHHDIGVRQGTGGGVLLLDSTTYQPVGLMDVWSGKPTAGEREMAKTKHLDIDLPAGTVTSSLVYSVVAVVDRPGER